MRPFRRAPGMAAEDQERKSEEARREGAQLFRYAFKRSAERWIMSLTADMAETLAW